MVVFFAFTNVGERVEYRLSGLATVEQKIRQTDIFFRSAYEKYRLYLNLLVRPTDGNGRNWTHHEPAAPHVWHKDWLSRIAPFRRFGKTELNRCSAKRQISLDLSIDGRPFIFGENYILFSIDPTKTFILDHPPIIAYSEPPHAEVWCNDRLSRAVSKQTIEMAQRHGITRSLRLNEKHLQPHSPPIRWQAEAEFVEQWRDELIGVLSDQGFARC